MRIILNEEVRNLGQRGDVKNVTPGYARNFLIPKGLAYQETKANLARFAAEKKKWEAKTVKEKTLAEEAAKAINGVSIKTARRVGEQELLYGSVTSADIAKLLEEKGFEIDKRKIELTEPIKRIGTFEIPIHLFKDIAAKVSLEVVAE